MSEPSAHQPMLTPKHLSEEIVVIPRNVLDELGIGSGFTPFADLGMIERTINESMMYTKRETAEQDERYKQIIPYLIFRHEQRYFIMQRKASAREQRLRNKVSLGIGGHIRKTDLSGSIAEWGLREFNEEVWYPGGLETTFLGIINDDSNAVGRVHVGLAFLLNADSDQISVRSELKKGSLMTLQEAYTHYEEMETWSQLVIDHLKQ